MTAVKKRGPAYRNPGVREGCPAEAHDTWSAYERLGCRCPDILDRVHAKGRRRSKTHTGIGEGIRGDLRPRLDPVTVELACDGRLDPMTTTERAAAVARLTRAGQSAMDIAHVLRISPRTVQRYRNGQIKTAQPA